MASCLKISFSFVRDPLSVELLVEELRSSSPSEGQGIQAGGTYRASAEEGLRRRGAACGGVGGGQCGRKEVSQSFGGVRGLVVVMFILLTFLLGDDAVLAICTFAR